MVRTASESEGASDTPGRRTAREGIGGGGISWESVKTLGTDEDDARCALLSAGNAGGLSSSRSVASPSSSSSEA